MTVTSKNSVNLLFKGKVYLCLPNETVLEALIRQNISSMIPCKNKDCQSCSMISLTEKLDKNSDQNKFKACAYIPKQNMEITLYSDRPQLLLQSEVININYLNKNVLEVILQCDSAVDYYGGQSVSIVNYNKITGSYPISSSCSASTQGRLEIHVNRYLGGDLSQWMFEQLKTGDQIKINGIDGELVHPPLASSTPLKSEQSQQALLLAAWNGGLGALIGLIQDIFESDYSKPVLLFHGVSDSENFYLQDELQEISKYYPNFKYIPCLEQNSDDGNVQFSSIHQAIKTLFKNLINWKVYLCGDQNSVHQLQRYAYLSGARLSDIHYQVTSF